METRERERAGVAAKILDTNYAEQTIQFLRYKMAVTPALSVHMYCTCRENGYRADMNCATQFSSRDYAEHTGEECDT